MQTFTREMRGIPFFLLKEYLQEMGGKETEPDVMQTAGWRVKLERMEPFRLGSLSVGQTRLFVELQDEAAEEFMRIFSMKTLRAGA
ncbi:MAG: hypothetical protein Fur002_02030 [Anaerolineales bacterium]